MRVAKTSDRLPSRRTTLADWNRLTGWPRAAHNLPQLTGNGFH